MQISLIQNPVQLIGPAVLISVLGYLVHFFGKIIADQKPLADDRNWEIELSGITFFINLVIFPGIFGLLAVHNGGYFNFGHQFNLILVSLIGIWLFAIGVLKSKNIYKIPLPPIKSFITSGVSENDLETIKKFIVSIASFSPLWLLQLFSAFLLYILTLEYRAGDIVWLTLIAAEIFLDFILLALDYSLKTTKLSKVDVYLLGSAEPLRGLTLLKMNDDNIRLRDNDKVIILNKSQVLKVEIKTEQNKEKTIQ